LGKGFYEFSFSSLEDVRRVRSVVSWNLEPGFLKLFAWTRDFNPNLQKNTTAQVWVRLYGLAQEYWRPKILFAIASSIGTPICTDAIANKPMFDRTFGQYARVLVDLDLSQTLRSKVLVERIGFAFFVELDYENLPPFCSHCNMVGHFIETCKKFHGKEDEAPPKEPMNKPTQKNDAPKKYVQKKDKRVSKNNDNEEINVEIPVQQVIEKNNETNSVVFVSSHPQSPILKVAEKSKGTMAASSNANRFSVLVDEENDVVDVNTTITQPDQVVGGEEVVVAQVVDCDDSSQDSEFVDATQLVPDIPGSDDDTGNSQPSSQERSEPNSQERIHRDMQFLKESWANIADQEEEESSLLAAADKGPSPSGFQMVVSKASKQAKSKVSNNSLKKSSYGTRSKVVQPKPSR
jgi:hypothetical protein